MALSAVVAGSGKQHDQKLPVYQGDSVTGLLQVTITLVHDDNPTAANPAKSYKWSVGSCHDEGSCPPTPPLCRRTPPRLRTQAHEAGEGGPRLRKRHISAGSCLPNHFKPL